MSKVAEEGDPRAIGFPRHRPKDAGLGYELSHAGLTAELPVDAAARKPDASAL